MNYRPRKLHFIGILAVVFSQNLVGLSIAENVYSQEISQKIKFPSGKGAIKFPSGRDRGKPQTTSGGGTRLRGVPNSDESGSISCLTANKDELSLNVLTPSYKNVVTTASLTPTLYFYVPWTQAALGEILLTDENDKNKVYQTVFTLPSRPGIAKLTLRPQNTLVPGKKYTWSLKIICNQHYRDNDISIVGKLEYQTLDRAAAQYLKTKGPLDKAKFYARRGYWLDTLENAAALRSKQPQEWTELLRSVGLEALSNQPFVDCCTPKLPD